MKQLFLFRQNSKTFYVCYILITFNSDASLIFLWWDVKWSADCYGRMKKIFTAFCYFVCTVNGVWCLNSQWRLRFREFNWPLCFSETIQSRWVKSTLKEIRNDVSRIHEKEKLFPISITSCFIFPIAPGSHSSCLCPDKRWLGWIIRPQ